MGGDLPTVRTYINDFIGTKLDNYLHKNPQQPSNFNVKFYKLKKREKELSGIRKLARERAKKAKRNKIRDCRIHLGDMKKEKTIDPSSFYYGGRLCKWIDHKIERCQHPSSV